MITVREMIEVLEGLNPMAEIRIAYQPTYPLWCVAEGVAPGVHEGGPFLAECPDCGRDAVHAPECESGELALTQDPGYAECVYITTSDSQSGYASELLWEVGREFIS